MSRLRTKQFAIRLTKRISESKNPKLRQLDSAALQEVVQMFFEELTLCLKEGHRVIFDGWISIFTNPVKRKCFDAPDEDGVGVGSPTERPQIFVFAQRVRFRPLSKFRDQAETEITEEEYLLRKPTKNNEKEAAR